MKAKLPPGVDGWGAGHGEDAFVAGVGPKGLGPGVGVDTSGVVVVPGQLVGVEPNVLVLVLLPNKFVPEVLLLPPNKFVLLLLLLPPNIVLLLLLLLLNIVLLLMAVDATGELKLLLLLRAS